MSEKELTPPVTYPADFVIHMMERVSSNTKNAGPDGKLDITHADFKNWEDGKK
jgi:hypothetical protein